MSTVAQTTSTPTVENLYEGMFLLDSARFAADPDGVTQELLETLEKAGATVVAQRPWLDGKLAYSIEGRRKGLHFLTLFRMNGTGIAEIDRVCKLNEKVLRHLIIKHPPSLFEAMVQALNPEKQPSESPDEDKATDNATDKATETSSEEAEQREIPENASE